MTVHVVGDPTPLYEEKVAQQNQQIADLEAENRRLKALLLAQGPQELNEQVKRLQTMSKAQGDHIKQLEAELSKLSSTATDTRGTDAPSASAAPQPSKAAKQIAAKHNRGLPKPKGKKKK